MKFAPTQVTTVCLGRTGIISRKIKHSLAFSNPSEAFATFDPQVWTRVVKDHVALGLETERLLRRRGNKPSCQLFHRLSGQRGDIA